MTVGKIGEVIMHLNRNVILKFCVCTINVKTNYYERQHYAQLLKELIK